jgi:hypothetical protein
VAGLTVHVLTAGHGYDIDDRRPRWPKPAPSPRAVPAEDAQAPGKKQS